jgi:hypothetical protein
MTAKNRETQQKSCYVSIAMLFNFHASIGPGTWWVPHPGTCRICIHVPLHQRLEAKPTVAKGAGKDEADNAHQLDQDVEGRATGILEWIANGIANHGCFVSI